MAISKLNAEQFANMAVNAAGVNFEYAGKDGKNTAMHFFGADYEATVKTQDEMFRLAALVRRPARCGCLTPYLIAPKRTGEFLFVRATKIGFPQKKLFVSRSRRFLLSVS